MPCITLRRRCYPFFFSYVFSLPISVFLSRVWVSLVIGFVSMTVFCAFPTYWHWWMYLYLLIFVLHPLSSLISSKDVIMFCLSPSFGELRFSRRSLIKNKLLKKTINVLKFLTSSDTYLSIQIWIFKWY